VSTVRRTLGRAKQGVFRAIKHRVVWPSLSAFRHWRTRVYFVSYPKSGRTWLRAMVGKALCDRYGLPERLLLKTYLLTSKAGLRRTRWWHDGSDIAFAYPSDRLPTSKRRYRSKTIVLVIRNVKDTLVSSYFQATKRVNVFDGSLSEFIRDDRFGAKKILTFYNLWHASQSVPRAFHLVRYEDLHRDPRAGLRQALDVVGADVAGESILDRAIEYASFDRMKEMERGKTFDNPVLRASDQQDEDSFKVRRGVVRGYVDYLSEEDVRYIDGVIAEIGDPFDSEGLRGSDRAGARARGDAGRSLDSTGTDP
jgi:hypothetical protein